MNMKFLTLSAMASTILIAATPMVLTSMSTDSGGAKSAIDAYSDGAGVLIINNTADSKIDNSVMNSLVFKYGDEAKAAGTTLSNEIAVLSSTSTTQEKYSTVKLRLAEVVINPPVNGTSCDDGNPQTVSDIWTNGFCTGNNIENQLCSDGNIQTINDKYHNGICGGTNVEGVVCNDNVAQTINDVYHNGVCAGTNVEGVACNDNNILTVNDQYLAGICIGKNITIPICADNAYSWNELTNLCEKGGVSTYSASQEISGYTISADTITSSNLGLQKTVNGFRAYYGVSGVTQGGEVYLLTDGSMSAGSIGSHLKMFKVGAGFAFDWGPLSAPIGATVYKSGSGISGETVAVVSTSISGVTLSPVNANTFRVTHYGVGAVTPGATISWVPFYNGVYTCPSGGILSGVTCTVNTLLSTPGICAEGSTYNSALGKCVEN